MTDDNKKSCSINSDKTDNITFKAKGFVKTFFKNKCSPVISENPLKLSIPNPQEKLKYMYCRNNKRLAVMQAIFLTKRLTGLWPFSWF